MTLDAAAERFSRRYPCVYHVCAKAAAETIRQHGFYSTSSMLDKISLSEAKRDLIRSMRREESISKDHPLLGPVVFRDQKPINDKKLAYSLVGWTKEEFYRQLNSQIFFWVQPARVDGFLQVYPDSEVVTVSTKRLLDLHSDAVRVTIINIGATYRRAALRGPDSFLKIGDIPKGRKPVEVCVPNYVGPEVIHSDDPRRVAPISR